MDHRQWYELVIGLEVHAQLLTHTKAYSQDANVYGAMPNTQLSPISLGLPGVLPKGNQKVVEFAMKMGLACGSKIAEIQQYARKNYFYPDLPKGYQITQDTTPICSGGKIRIKDKNGNWKAIHLTRIHIEEDSGKSIHDLDPTYTLIDLNRAGVPLIEIVSMPEIANGQEAYNYLTEIRKLLRYLDICDGNMEEGSMRCDINISVRKKGEQTFRNRVEIKNVNSFRNVMRAIEYEFERQVVAYENQQTIRQETRGFDAVEGVTFTQRVKEGAADYRYFPDPDLPMLKISVEDLDQVKQSLPLLPHQLYEIYTERYGLSDYDAQVLIENKAISDYYNAVLQTHPSYKLVANWVTGAIKAYLNETATAISSFPIKPESLGQLTQLIEEGQLTHHIADKFLFPELLKNPILSPFDLAEKNGWLIEKDSSGENKLKALIQEALEKYPDKVLAYRSGKKGLAQLFVGEVMKQSKGKLNPSEVQVEVQKALDQI